MQAAAARALFYCGSGMVKRLRPTSKGIRIISDNPSIPDELAENDEVRILGLVAGYMRKV